MSNSFETFDGDIMITYIEVNTFIPVLVTVIKFQGHGGIFNFSFFIMFELPWYDLHG